MGTACAQRQDETCPLCRGGQSVAEDRDTEVNVVSPVGSVIKQGVAHRGMDGFLYYQVSGQAGQVGWDGDSLRYNGGLPTPPGVGVHRVRES